MCGCDAAGVQELTSGEVTERLGIKASMLRRYAAALEVVTGISLQVDPARGRLYPPEAVALLEAARAHLMAHPGGSVEGALRAVTGESAGGVALPARVPVTITPDDLRAALAGVLAPMLGVLEEQREQAAALGGEVGELRAEVASLTAELQAARAAVERLEVMTHAALPSSTAAPVEPAPVPQPGAALGGLQVLARFLGLKPRGPGSRSE